MLMSNRLAGAFIVLISFTSCFVVENTFSGLPPGKWRAVLKLEPRQITPNPKGQPLPEKLNLKFEEVTAGELPFTFEVIYENETDFYIEIVNGEERIRLDNIIMGRDPATAKDTIRIDIPVFDSYFSGIYEENLIEGKWVVRNRDEYQIPFVARYGQAHRFTTLRKAPAMNLSGKWKTYFEVETNKPFPAIGEFKQEGNHLLGTFRTETGDYRYLEGTVQADKLYLSCFDGGHAFLFEGKIQPDSSIVGIFRSGKHYKTIWEAERDPDFTLQSPDSITTLKEGTRTISFSFPDKDGNIISLSDERFEGKAKILQLMGTWCPNCWDETRFLLDYFQQNPTEEIEIIALAFEKYRDKERALRAIATYQDRMKLPYPVVWAGFHEKAEAAMALPMLDEIVAFPTMIFLDRQNQVVKIHTGFNGPATSEYEAFKANFDNTIESLKAVQ